MTDEKPFQRQVFFKPVAPSSNAWLTPEGVEHQCGFHFDYIFYELENDYPELYAEFVLWKKEQPSHKLQAPQGLYEFLHDNGWWKKSQDGNYKLHWVGDLDATPAQRRTINRDLGERQSSEYFKGLRPIS